MSLIYTFYFAFTESSLSLIGWSKFKVIPLNRSGATYIFVFQGILRSLRQNKKLCLCPSSGDSLLLTAAVELHLRYSRHQKRL